MKLEDFWSVGVYSPLGAQTGRYELIFTDRDRAVKCYNYLKQVKEMWKWFRPGFIHYEDDYGVKLGMDPEAIGAVYFTRSKDTHRRNIDIGDTQHVIAATYKSDVDVKTGFRHDNDGKVGKEDE